MKKAALLIVIAIITFSLLPARGMKEEDMEQYRSYIDNILKTRGRFSLGQLNEKIQEKDKSEFKKIIENDDTEEIMYNSMVKIKENVGKYFKQQNEETLKEADVNIELF